MDSWTLVQTKPTQHRKNEERVRDGNVALE